ncbi:MAG: 4-hydroxy-tetrahydrodipicolinate reductase [Selenomonadaceae bacterium]|nr:4-hydroxy-tetrahydrodipicolinate reductase [Selenomonadaceae bacterium]
MIRVLVNGANGRMGRTVCEAVKNDPDLEFVGGVDVFGDGVERDLKTAIEKFQPQVMIDFTRPDVVLENVLTALNLKVAVVVGTTGLNDESKEKIRLAAESNQTPAFIAPNFAIGAVLMMLFARQAAKYLPDVEIIELHHDKKLDAPSGTAIQTAAMISEVREKHTQGHPDEVEKIPCARGAQIDGIRIHSVRLPGYVAHQEVIFGGLGQTLSIRHDSMDRNSFMPGVVLAAKKVLDLKGLTVGLEKILD